MTHTPSIKTTRTTFKSFLNKNLSKLYIKELSHFDGMVDSVMPVEDTFKPLCPVSYGQENHQEQHNLGYEGIWLVGGGRDYFSPWRDDEYIGYEVYNSCGSFILAKKI